MLVALALAACAAGRPNPPAQGGVSAAPLDGRTIVETKCTQCHDLTRVQTAKKDRSGWEDTVARMESNGLQVTPEEKSAAIDYLTATFK
jgi:cytochrome c5